MRDHMHCIAGIKEAYATTYAVREVQYNERGHICREQETRSSIVNVTAGCHTLYAHLSSALSHRYLSCIIDNFCCDILANFYVTKSKRNS